MFRVFLICDGLIDDNCYSLSDKPVYITFELGESKWTRRLIIKSQREGWRTIAKRRYCPHCYRMKKFPSQMKGKEVKILKDISDNASGSS